MTQTTRTTVTRLLHQVEGGDNAAVDQLFPLVYDELRELAHRHRWRWHGDETLGTTALVNEAYLKLAGQQPRGTDSRAHFLAVASKAMRHILSDYSRDRQRQKRGGGLQKLSLDALDVEPGAPALFDAQADMAAALEAALARLEQTDRRLTRVVECRFFGGMSIADTATVLDVSPATVKRDWVLARAWLYRELQPHREP